jgi:hypothetical protein
MPAAQTIGGTFITPRLLSPADWPKVALIATNPVNWSRLNPANAKKWIFGRRRSKPMLTVDERQFEMRYAPIACGLQLLVAGCVVASILGAIWWFLFR